MRPDHQGRMERLPITGLRWSNRYKLAIGLVMLGIVLIVCAGLLIAFLKAPPRDSTGGVEGNVQEQEPYLSIENIKLVESVSSDWSYTERIDDVYEPGDKVMIYFEVAGYTNYMENGQYKIDIVQSSVTTFPDGSIVEELSGMGAEQHAESFGYQSFVIPYENHYSFFEGDPEGVYTTIISVEDRLTGLKAQESISCELRT